VKKEIRKTQEGGVELSFLPFLSPKIVRERFWQKQVTQATFWSDSSEGQKVRISVFQNWSEGLKNKAFYQR